MFSDRAAPTVRPFLRSHLRLSISLALFAAACSGKTTTEGGTVEEPPIIPPAQTGYFGTYTLRSTNGVVVPGIYLQGAGYSLEVRGGEVVLNSNFTYQFRMRFRLTRNGVTTTPEWTESGTFTASSSSGVVFLDMIGGPATSGFSTIFDSEISFILEAPLSVLAGPGGASVYLGDARFKR